MHISMRDFNDPSLETVLSSFAKHIQEGGGLQHTTEDKLVAVSHEVFASMNELDKAKVSDDLEKLKEINPEKKIWIQLIDSISYKLFSSKQSGDFKDIPEEIFVHMLSFIEPDNLFRLKLVSRKWNELAQWAEIEVMNSARNKFRNYFLTADEVLHWLKKNSMRHKLKVVDFSNMRGLTKEHFELLLEMCGDLRVLNLQNCNFAAAMKYSSLVTLASSDKLQFLEILNLSRVGLDDHDITTLRRSKSFPKLKKLFLSDNSVGPIGAASLAQSSLLISLDTLLLSNNPIGPDGIKSLATSENIPLLKRLYISGCKIGDAGTASIAISQYFHALIELNINFNGIGLEGAHQLAQEVVLTRLEYLDIGNNRLDTEGKEALKNSKNFPLLRTLFL